MITVLDAQYAHRLEISAPTFPVLGKPLLSLWVCDVHLLFCSSFSSSSFRHSFARHSTCSSLSFTTDRKLHFLILFFVWKKKSRWPTHPKKKERNRIGKSKVKGGIGADAKIRATTMAGMMGLERNGISDELCQWLHYPNFFFLKLEFRHWGDWFARQAI